MPGPRNQKKPNTKSKNNKTKDKPAAASGQPQPVQTPTPQCQTLEEDEMTRCDKPPTEGHPQKERCKKHQTQYRIMYKKYKDAGKIVDELKNDIPDEEKINQYKDVSSLLKKARLIQKYVEAVRVERTGRQIHQTRFFLKVDDGHKMRVKVLAKEIAGGVKALNALHARAYHLYVKENSLPDWANHPASDMESLSDSHKFVPVTGVPQSQMYNSEEDEDLIDLRLRREKAGVLHCFEPFLNINSAISIQLKLQGLAADSEKEGDFDNLKYELKLFQDIMQQYIRRIVFHDPALFMKALDKVSFEDLILSKEFDIEDISTIYQLFTERLGFGLRWYKDAVVEALAIRDAGTAANVGVPADRIQITGGWTFNRTWHLRKTSNEAWYWLLKTLEPPADIENRFVRLCNSYDDLLGILSFGALGLYPHPSFCQSKHGNAVMYRNHLSLAGVVICDMVSAAKPPSLSCGPVPSTRRPRQPGCIVWAELQSRSYMFGALRDEPDAFQQAFLDELKARPDLFQIITRCDNDPPRVVKTFGNGETEALPHIRAQTFEAPAASPQNRPQGPGQWEVYRSAFDILYGTQDTLGLPVGGYLVSSPVNRESDVNKKTNYFFHFKTFPVTYIVILDTTPNRHYTFLAKQVAWAALRAKGYGKGVYEPHKYAIASDKTVQRTVCPGCRRAWVVGMRQS